MRECYYVHKLRCNECKKGKIKRDDEKVNEWTGKPEKRREIDARKSADPSGLAPSKMTEERMSEGVERFRLSNGDGEKVLEGGSDALEGLLESESYAERNSEIMKAKSY